MVGVGVHPAQLESQRRKAVAPTHAVERQGMVGENEGARHVEQGLGDPGAEQLGERVFRYRVALAYVGAPVRVADRQVGDMRQPGADRKRQAEIAYHQVWVDALEQVQIVGNVALERLDIIERAPFGEGLQEVRAFNRVQGVDRSAEILEQPVVMRVAGEIH
jgi:hypothetical protein